MSFNGSGLFAINTAGQPVVSGTTISSAVFNAFTADIGTGLSTCITKDGQTTVTANIPMASHKFTGLSAGSANGDSVRWEQISAIATWAATPSSANLAAAMTDETGTGALVFATSPALVTPLLGTPTSGTLTSCTGLPISTGVSGLGTGIATFLATPSSANLASAMTDKTGTAGTLVFSVSPTFTGTLTAATISQTAGADLGLGGNIVCRDSGGTTIYAATGDVFMRAGTGGNLKLGAGGTNSWVQLTSDGRFFGAALHNNAGAVTGTTNQYVGSGTYTPSITATTNVASSTMRSIQWVRVGNVVIVGGEVDITTTTGGSTSTVLSLSLPIASDLANLFNLGGGGSWFGIVPPQAASIIGDATNNVMTVTFNANAAGTGYLSFTFMYVIL